MNDEFTHLETSCSGLQSALTNGELTARRLCELYLERIAALDTAGPTVNAILELNPEALAVADERDQERHAGRLRGPLHGIPILIKDNIDTADLMMTTAGSLALVGSIPARDAFIVTRLRAAGAIILGKTNLSEWANFRSTRSSSGWSSRGGQTRNPYVLTRSPSGSSSGSGAAVAANFCAAALGTETDGSVVSPAAASGIVGLKPTVGLVSRSGIIPIAASQDTAGPMTRTVRDAAVLLNILAGWDPRDPATKKGSRHLAPDYTTFLDPQGLKGARLGVARQFFGRHPLVDQLMEEALIAISKAGAILIDPVEIETQGKWDDAEKEVLLYEFKDGLNRYLAGLGPQTSVKSLAEVIAFNSAHAAEAMPIFGQEILEKAEEKGGLTDPAYRKALAKCRRLTRSQGIDAVMKKYELDALIAPTRAPAWLIDHVNGDCTSGGTSSPPAVSGYPHLTLPLGMVQELPVNVSFMAGPWQEGVLLKLGYAFEQLAQRRQPPRFLEA